MKTGGITSWCFLYKQGMFYHIDVHHGPRSLRPRVDWKDLIPTSQAVPSDGQEQSPTPTLSISRPSSIGFNTKAGTEEVLATRGSEQNLNEIGYTVVHASDSLLLLDPLRNRDILQGYVNVSNAPNSTFTQSHHTHLLLQFTPHHNPHTLFTTSFCIHLNALGTPTTGIQSKTPTLSINTYAIRTRIILTSYPLYST